MVKIGKKWIKRFGIMFVKVKKNWRSNSLLDMRVIIIERKSFEAVLASERLGEYEITNFFFCKTDVMSKVS